MTKEMYQSAILHQEHLNSYTSITGHEKFDNDGYLVIKKVYNPNDLTCDLPERRGQYNYFGSIDKFNHNPIEGQVDGSTSRYHYPLYKKTHSEIRIKIEDIIGRKLYNTYYYDRFYNPGQSLAVHTDRPACEISITVNVGSNIQEPWPIWIKTPDVYDDPKKKTKIIKKGKNKKVILKPGDGMIYKGCERPHWRDSMPGNIIDRNLYYHQIFFHYVLQDGHRAHYAFDASIQV